VNVVGKACGLAGKHSFRFHILICRIAIVGLQPCPFQHNTQKTAVAVLSLGVAPDAPTTLVNALVFVELQAIAARACTTLAENPWLGRERSLSSLKWRAPYVFAT
jgi:hypothetical protein